MTSEQTGSHGRSVDRLFSSPSAVFPSVKPSCGLMAFSVSIYCFKVNGSQDGAQLSRASLHAWPGILLTHNPQK